MTNRKVIEIWMEGVNWANIRFNARRIATIRARSLREACTRVLQGNPHYNTDTLSLWGCKLFDNESQARRNFG